MGSLLDRYPSYVSCVFFDEAKMQQVKPNVGHSEGASGTTSLIKTVLALEHRVIPPNINFDKPNPKSMHPLAAFITYSLTTLLQVPFESARLRVPLEATSWPTNRERASVNSFGIGGANAHVSFWPGTSRSILKLQGHCGFRCFIWHKILCQQRIPFSSESSPFTRILCKSSQLSELERSRLSATCDDTPAPFERFSPHPWG